MEQMIRLLRLQKTEDILTRLRPFVSVCIYRHHYKYSNWKRVKRRTQFGNDKYFRVPRCWTVGHVYVLSGVS